MDLNDVFMCHLVNHYSLHTPYGKMRAPKFITTFQVFLFNIKNFINQLDFFSHSTLP